MSLLCALSLIRNSTQASPTHASPLPHTRAQAAEVAQQEANLQAHVASITARVTLCERAAAATEAVDDLKAEIDDAEESHTSIEQRAGKQLIKYGKGKKMEELWQGWDTVQMMGAQT